MQSARERKGAALAEPLHFLGRQYVVCRLQVLALMFRIGGHGNGDDPRLAA